MSFVPKLRELTISQYASTVFISSGNQINFMARASFEASADLPLLLISSTAPSFTTNHEYFCYHREEDVAALPDKHLLFA